MSQGKEDLKKIRGALFDAQDSGGLFPFLQAEVDILSQYAAGRLLKMIRKKWPGEAATGGLDLDRNTRWLLGRLAPHLWKTKIEPEELIASFREGTGRIGHLPEGVLRALHGTLDSSMPGWKEKNARHPQTHVPEGNLYHFPPLEEAKEIFAAKHGDVGWAPTDEVAMVEVRRVEAEEAEALAEYLRKRDGFNGLMRDYRDAVADARARIRRAEKTYKITCEKAHKDPEAHEEFLRKTAEDRSALATSDGRFKEQCKRNDAAEELLREDEVWPPVQGA